MKKGIVGLITVGALVGSVVGGFSVIAKATERQMPDLTGLNYQQAMDYHSGIMFFDEDNLKNRAVLSEKNWKICRQTTPAGATISLLHAVTVYVVKLNEDCTLPGATYKPKPVVQKKSLSERICEDLGPLSTYQVLTKYNVFLKDKGDGNAMAKTLYGHVMIGCEDKLIDESTGIGYFIQSWAPEIFGTD